MFPFDSAPTLIWTVCRDSKIATCEVRFVPIGVEVRVLRNGNLLWSQIFASGDHALLETEKEKERMLAEGWRQR
jgi:hypothetical protein